MSNSSDRDASAFERVKLSNVRALLNVLSDYALDDEAHVERRYRDLAADFTDTLNFAMEVGIVRRDGRRVLRGTGIGGDESQINGECVLQLLHVESRYRREALNYLRAFEITDGEVLHRPEISSRVQNSWCRNLLMEAGVVIYRELHDDYLLSREHVSLYAAARQATPGYSAQRLRSKQQEKAAIGDAAELAVVDWERRRLGPPLADRVVHVGSKNVLAGYDVLSVSVEPDGVRHRYIEVKAVSQETWQFFWTENEVAVASVLGGSYYLYLVPIGPAGPQVEQTAIVCDPHRTVLLSDDWRTEANVYVCQPVRGIK